jgi:hypothetical protein
MKRKVVELKDALKEKRATDAAFCRGCSRSCEDRRHSGWCRFRFLGWQTVGFGSGKVITRPSAKSLWIEICTRTCACR